MEQGDGFDHLLPVVFRLGVVHLFLSAGGLQRKEATEIMAALHDDFARLGLIIELVIVDPDDVRITRLQFG